MAARRWVLLSLALLSLAILAYGGVSFAFSVPIEQRMVDAMALPGHADLAEGERALVVPLPDGASNATVPTWAANGSESFGAPGAVLLLGDPGASFPNAATNTSIARALAWVAPDKDGAYAPAMLNLSGAPSRNATNLSVDVGALALGRSGFIVKGDAEDAPRFVEADRVVGQVARFDPAAAYDVMLAIGGLGFVVPLAVLIVTHRGAGRKGLPAGAAPGSAPVGTCPECRAPLAAGQDFCTRCGAWLKPGAKP